MVRLFDLANEHWSKLVWFVLVTLTSGAVLFLEQNPWVLAWLFLPIILLETVPAWKWLRSGGGKMTRPWFLLLAGFLAVLLLSTLLPATNPQNTLRGYEGRLPRNWLGLGGWGDWRYLVAPRAPRTHALAVLTIPKPPPDASPEAVRLNLANLVQAVANGNANGVALDVFLQRSTAVDSMFGAIIEGVRKDEFPVYIGFDFHFALGNLIPIDVPEGLTDVFGEEHRGHIVSYRERDDVVRSVPMRFGGDQGAPALSARVADYLQRRKTGEPLELPAGMLLMPLPPSAELMRIDYEKLVSGEASADWFNGRFVLIGEDSERDLKRTPYRDEPIPGVLIHAYAVEALLKGSYITRPAWWLSLLAVVFPLASLAGRFSRRPTSLRPILWSALAVSGLTVLVAVVAMALGRVWFEVGYLLTSVLFFLPLCLLLRRLRRKTQGPIRLQVENQTE